MTGERGKRLARRMLSCLRKAYGHPKVTVRRSPLEELLIGIVSDGGSERRAEASLGRLMEDFVDWNEVRVGSAADIAASLDGIQNPIATGEHIRMVLERISLHNNELQLDFLGEATPETAASLVNGIAGFPESALSRVTMLMFKHDTFPPTTQVVNLCRRVGLLGEGDPAMTVAQLKKLIPRASMLEFHTLAYNLAAGPCRDQQQACEDCVLRFDCKTATEKAPAKSKSHATPAAVARKAALVRSKNAPKPKAHSNPRPKKKAKR